jgi:hypothetical protein
MVDTDRTIKKILSYDEEILGVDEEDSEDLLFRTSSKKYNKRMW